ncbi:MAG: zinc-binding dehydrogenase [Candidatus Latescibacteria bacterium]|nr:zinc-binding dehydrogenase [Candidatus Latescibacterota bacterium]
MAKEMRALQITAPGEAQIVNVEVPTPPPGEVLVRVEAVTICTQWDLTMLAGKDIFERPDYPKYPIQVGVPGHEMSGVVVDVGPKSSWCQDGDRVAAWSSRGSQRKGRMGYYAEYAAIPVEDLMVAPDHLSFEEIAPLELAMCVAASIRQAGDLAGKRVAVGGAGPAGLFAIQMARTLGAKRVVAFDPQESRRSLATELGAEVAYDPTSDDSAALGDRDFDVAFECSGVAASAQNLMRVTSGGIHLFGVVHGTIGFKTDHWGRNVALHGYPGHNYESAEMAMALISSGAVKTRPIVNRTVGFEDYLEGIESLKDGSAAKLCVVP